MRRPNGWELVTLALAGLAIAVIAFFAFQGARLVHQQREAVERLEQEAEDRQDRVERAESRIEGAVDEILREVRTPAEGRDTRAETFDRIRQLCESDPGCVP